MTGSTHIAVGVASTVLILQPKTVPECLCALTGGIIGGMISDIDSPGKRKAMDYLAGNGAVDYLLTHMGPILFIAGVLFIGISIYGTQTIHRTFMHH